MGQLQSLGYWTKGRAFGPRASLDRWRQLAWQATSQVWINSSPSNQCISRLKAQLAPLFFIQHLICTYWIKGILRFPDMLMLWTFDWKLCCSGMALLKGCYKRCIVSGVHYDITRKWTVSVSLNVRGHNRNNLQLPSNAMSWPSINEIWVWFQFDSCIFIWNTFMFIFGRFWGGCSPCGIELILGPSRTSYDGFSGHQPPVQAVGTAVADIPRDVRLIVSHNLASPGHQHPCYYLSKIGKFLSQLTRDFNYMCLVNLEERHKM